MTCSLSDGRVSTTLSSMAEQNGHRIAFAGVLHASGLLSKPPMNDLNIIVNGQPRSASPGTTVAALLVSMGVDPQRVAVERNQEVVPRRGWSDATLAEGDRREIVAFIGGGSDNLPPAAGATDDRSEEPTSE